MFSQCALLFVGIAAVSLSPKFPSEVSHLSIPNAHWVETKSIQKVIRGSHPRTKKQIKELIQLGVTNVIIFKNDISGDTDKEKAAFLEHGLREKHIHHIPMAWKEIDQKESFQMTLKALRVIMSNKETTYFHCSLGEDRTGYLAGIYSLLVGNRSIRKIFQEEMCENGYEAGDPGKPGFVVKAVQEELTPLFLQFAYRIKRGEINESNIGHYFAYKKASDTQLKKELGLNKLTLQCEPSSKYIQIN